MILNTGLRTDLAAYYGEWLFRRFREGFVYSRNPLFPQQVNVYDLSPDKVDAIVFCSKNYAPILPRLHEITERYRTYFFATVTLYERDIEPHTPPVLERIETLRALSRLVGRQRVIWRYEPVLLTEKYTAEAHADAFERLCAALAPHIGGAVFSFAEMNVRLQRRLPNVLPIEQPQKRALASAFASSAGKYRVPLKFCGPGRDYPELGVVKSGCARLDEIGRANGCTFRNLAHKGNRRGCLCIESRDIGWYDTCPNGCKYCNAVTSAEAVRENRKLHDAASPLLVGNLNETDVLTRAVQESYLKNDGRQISLFD